MKKDSFLILLLGVFFCGFFLGILVPNLLWGQELGQGGFAGLYLLDCCNSQNFNKGEYFLYLLSTRGAWGLLCGLCGFSVFGIPAGVVTVAGMGFFLGGIFTLSLLQFGLQGFLLGIGLLMPQYLVYLPVSIIFLAGTCKMSQKFWTNQRISWKECKGYILRAVFCGLLFLGGIGLESYINPVILKIILTKGKFF